MAVHAQDQEAGPGEERSQLDGSSMKCHLVNGAEGEASKLVPSPSWFLSLQTLACISLEAGM